jgi:ubiquinone/menaquinone biosynthesis C-methylase UbiE
MTETQSRSDWWNRTRYRLYAPVYDLGAKPLENGRKRAIERLDLEPDDEILLLGCGTGNDLEYVPAEASVSALDITPAMVRRTESRGERLGIDVDARIGDARDLPFEDDRFDAVLVHLVVSVVPDPEQVMAETARVLAPDGRVSIFDKFVPEETTPSLARRMVNPLARFLFADLNRALEPMVEDTNLELGERESFLGGLYTVTVARPATVE